MLTELDCASCIIDDLQGALSSTVQDEALRLDILCEAIAWLGDEFDVDRIPSYYITRVHRLLKQRAGIEMPFRQLRQRCNQAGLAVRQDVAERLAHIDDDLERLRTIALWAIAGNHLDFRTVGTGYELAAADIIGQLESVISEGLCIDQTPALLNRIQISPRVLYLADNVGEIALDTLLVTELQRHGCQVTVAVKGGPITSDAVWQDAHDVGMDTLAPIVLTGPDTLGLPLDEMSPRLMDELQHADLVLSKGQANYYACSELVQSASADIFCLLRTKCLVTARSLGLNSRCANVSVWLQHRHS